MPSPLTNKSIDAVLTTRISVELLLRLDEQVAAELQRAVEAQNREPVSDIDKLFASSSVVTKFSNGELSKGEAKRALEELSKPLKLPKISRRTIVEAALEAYLSNNN